MDILSNDFFSQGAAVEETALRTAADRRENNGAKCMVHVLKVDNHARRWQLQ